MWSILIVSIISAVAQADAGRTGVQLTFADRVEVRGQIRGHLVRVYDRLCAPPLNDPEFVLADVHFRKPRIFTRYSGDISGRMLGALTAAGSILGRDTPMIEALTSGFIEHQKTDGHYGADQDLGNEINQKRDMPILWGNGRLLLALAERCRDTRDKRLLKAAVRLGEYVLSTRKYYGKEENFNRVGGKYASGFTTCYPSLIDGLVALGEATGDKRFYDEARFISRLALLDTEFVKHHSHGRLTAYRGMLDLDRLTGTHDFVEAVSAGCKTINDEYLMPLGGVGELFERDYPRDEACSEADWIRVNFLLWQATGRTDYLDAVEHAVQNHLYATQVCNGGFGHRVFTTLRDGDKSYYDGGISPHDHEAYWCCTMHVAQVLADVARWGVMVSQGRILITFLSEVRSAIGVGGKTMIVTVDKGLAGDWKVSLESDGPAEAVLRLRVPGWADLVTVDGKRYPAQDGWVILPQSWTGTKSLRVKFPNEVRFAGVYRPQLKANEPVRIFAGADMYCLADAYVDPDIFTGDVVPLVTMAANRPCEGQIPVIIEGDRGWKQRANLVPMSHRPAGGCRYLFKVRRMDSARFGKFAQSASPQYKAGQPIILNIAGDCRHDIYLNGKLLLSRSHFSQSPFVSAYTKQQSNVVAVKAQTKSKNPGLIGLIMAGDKIAATHTEGWTVVPCPKELTKELLCAPAKSAGEAVELSDLGKFDSAPWEPIPAHFAGTEARWIWPAEASAEQNQQGWLFLYQFDVAP